MRWFDDSAVNFTNWKDGSSPDLAPLDTCGVLHSNTGKWEKVSCLDEVENGVVCEAKQGMTPRFDHVIISDSFQMMKRH